MLLTVYVITEPYVQAERYDVYLDTMKTLLMEFGTVLQNLLWFILWIKDVTGDDPTVSKHVEPVVQFIHLFA